MTTPQKGEIRRVATWNYVGHEATGGRPSLIISPNWFNEQGIAVIAPLTTPGPNHENWWEPYIACTDSACLVPDTRTVSSKFLTTAVKGSANKDELEDVLSAFSRLTNGSDEMSDGDCNRGEVWEADLSNRDRRSQPDIRELLILHYNSSNCMAMTAFVTSRKRNKSPIVAEIQSSTRLRGRFALLGQMRPVAAEERLLHRVGTVSRQEMSTISKKLNAFLKVPAVDSSVRDLQPLRQPDQTNVDR